VRNSVDVLKRKRRIVDYKSKNTTAIRSLEKSPAQTRDDDKINKSIDYLKE
jgi:hypothetical protein